MLVTAPLAAHDHWIAPSDYRPAVGERVDLHLFVGHPAEYEDKVRDPRRIVRFEAFGADGKAQPVLGLDGKAPAGLFRPKASGAVLLAYQSDHAFVELDPATYADYLVKEGLEEIQAERERRGETDKPGRDSYARFDKALIRVAGDGASDEASDRGSSAGFDRVVGMPFELVLESDPSAWTAGRELAFRLQFEAKPIAGRQIKLVRLEAPYLVVLARTDADGRARFTPPESGPWCAFAVHQRRAEPEQKLEGDWEGFWASFALELGSPDAPAR